MVSELTEVFLPESLAQGGYFPYGERLDGTFGGDYEIDWNQLPQNKSYWDTEFENLDALVWLNESDPKPTVQQIIDWENERLNIIESKRVFKQNIKNIKDKFSITNEDYQIALDITEKIVNAFMKGQTPTITQGYNIFVSLLAGTSLEAPLKNYIEFKTGIVSFLPTITNAQKREIINQSELFLQHVITFWEKRIE